LMDAPSFGPISALWAYLDSPQVQSTTGFAGDFCGLQRRIPWGPPRQFRAVTARKVGSPKCLTHPRLGSIRSPNPPCCRAEHSGVLTYQVCKCGCYWSHPNLPAPTVWIPSARPRPRHGAQHPCRFRHTSSVCHLFLKTCPLTR
jgi:hypothetical protein